MCAYKENGDVESVKKREYLKQQHQLRTMTKSNNALSADDMIENLLSKKEIFKMKKDPNHSSIKSPQINYPGWLLAGYEPLLYKRVWDIVGTPSGFADTPKLTNLLLTSRLPTDVLGYIWSLSNVSLAPALSQIETYTSLALVALVQSGYSFTGVAVLNTLKEAPLPKLDYPLIEVPIMMPGPVFIPTVPQPADSSSYTSSSDLKHVFHDFGTTESKNSSELSFTSNCLSTPTTTVSRITDSFSLLDLDLSLPATSKSVKSDLGKSLVTIPVSPIISSKENTFEFSKESTSKESQPRISDKDLISEFFPTSKKNEDINLFSSFATKLPFTSHQDIQKQGVSLSDDLFGDFQSVNVAELKSTNNDEIEFDDFKSADFAPLTLLEVKDKPPQEEAVEPIPPHDPSKPDEKCGIEDLFPKCIVKSRDENVDLLASDEDRYSALRGLTASDDHDEFGDFLTACPKESSPLPPPLTGFQSNIQERAMEACIDVLEEAIKIFDSIDEEDVLNEVITDPRGVQYLEELIEVERIALRLRSALNKEELNSRLDCASNSLETYLKPHQNSYMTEETGPKCGICLCERGPAYVKYGINNFHAPCANLYLHRVDSILPIAPLM